MNHELWTMYHEIWDTQYAIRNTQYEHLPSTSVENPLQISPFMQNKPNFRKSQMDVSIYLQMDYENKSNWTLGQNKPNTNPIKPNLQKAKMNVNLTLTKDYRKNDDFSVRINKPNFQNGQNERKLTYNKGLQKKRFFRSPKSKPNQTQFFQLTYIPMQCRIK